MDNTITTATATGTVTVTTAPIFTVIQITNTDGSITINHTESLLTSAAAVHRELRPNLPSNNADYITMVINICQSGPAHIVVAADSNNNTVYGLCIYRYYTNTFNGIHFYIDDLITAAQYRSLSIGSAIINYCKFVAKSIGATSISLESGTHRTSAHRFYYNNGFLITLFSFATQKSLANYQYTNTSNNSNIEIIKLTDSTGLIQSPESIKLLSTAESVHRQLRPQLPNNIPYTDTIANICRSGPAHIILAIDNNNRTVLGLAMYRIIKNTFHLNRYYIDDLITDSANRSTGVGRAIMNYCKFDCITNYNQCSQVTLESGTFRLEAHKFYHREGLVIEDFSFVCKLI